MKRLKMGYHKYVWLPNGKRVRLYFSNNPERRKIEEAKYEEKYGVNISSSKPKKYTSGEPSYQESLRQQGFIREAGTSTRVESRPSGTPIRKVSYKEKLQRQGIIRKSRTWESSLKPRTVQQIKQGKLKSESGFSVVGGELFAGTEEQRERLRGIKEVIQRKKRSEATTKYFSDRYRSQTLGEMGVAPYRKLDRETGIRTQLPAFVDIRGRYTTDPEKVVTRGITPVTLSTKTVSENVSYYPTKIPTGKLSKIIVPISKLNLRLSKYSKPLISSMFDLEFDSYTEMARDNPLYMFEQQATKTFLKDVAQKPGTGIALAGVGFATSGVSHGLVSVGSKLISRGYKIGGTAIKSIPILTSIGLGGAYAGVKGYEMSKAPTAEMKGRVLGHTAFELGSFGLGSLAYKATAVKVSDYMNRPKVKVSQSKTTRHIIKGKTYDVTFTEGRVRAGKKLYKIRAVTNERWFPQGKDLLSQSMTKFKITQLGGKGVTKTFTASGRGLARTTLTDKTYKVTDTEVFFKIGKTQKSFFTQDFISAKGTPNLMKGTEFSFKTDKSGLLKFSSAGKFRSILQAEVLSNKQTQFWLTKGFDKPLKLPKGFKILPDERGVFVKESILKSTRGSLGKTNLNYILQPKSQFKPTTNLIGTRFYKTSFGGIVKELAMPKVKVTPMLVLGSKSVQKSATETVTKSLTKPVVKPLSKTLTFPSTKIISIPKIKTISKPVQEPKPISEVMQKAIQQPTLKVIQQPMQRVVQKPLLRPSKVIPSIGLTIPFIIPEPPPSPPPTGFNLPSFGEILGMGRKIKKGGRGFLYKADLESIFLNIGKVGKTPSIQLTGLESRPIIRSRRKKKR